MLNYNKNKLINECLVRYYETFAHTLDTADFVPEKYNDKINAYIFKNMKKAFKRLDREDKRFQKQTVHKYKDARKQKIRVAKLAKKQEKRNAKAEKKRLKNERKKSKKGGK